MNRFLPIFILLLYGCKEAQKGQVVKKDVESFVIDSFWFEEKRRYADVLGLVDLIKEKPQFHFRIWSEYQSIDIWRSDSDVFYGVLCNYVSHDTTFFRECINIGDSTARLIAQLFERYSIESIPQQDSIKEWVGQLDGGLYAIECRHDKNYSFKDYGGFFYSNDTVKEAIAMRNFLAETMKILESENSFFCFVNTLPKAVYRWEGNMGISPGDRPCKK